MPTASSRLLSFFSVSLISLGIFVFSSLLDAIDSASSKTAEVTEQLRKGEYCSHQTHETSVEQGLYSLFKGFCENFMNMNSSIDSTNVLVANLKQLYWGRSTRW